MRNGQKWMSLFIVFVSGLFSFQWCVSLSSVFAGTVSIYFESRLITFRPRPSLFPTQPTLSLALSQAISAYQRCIRELDAMLQRTALAASTIALAINSSAEGVALATTSAIAGARKRDERHIAESRERP